MADDERRRSSDREFDRLSEDLKVLTGKVEMLQKSIAGIQVLDEWRRNHDAYYQRETQLVAESFANVKADMTNHENRISKVERILEKHGVWIGIVSAGAIALVIAVVQHLAGKG